MVTAAHAQEAPITPTADTVGTAATQPQAPVPQRVAQPATKLRQPGFDLQFTDISVKELLKTLGEQFQISIIINNDVEGSIGYINLFNQTPDEALQNVMRAAPNLSITRTANGTYIVGKAQPGMGAPNTSMQSGMNFVPGNMGPQSISPSGGLGNFGDFNAPSGFEGNSQFGGSFGGTRGLPGAGALGTPLGNALPALGGQRMASNPMLDDLPTLVEANAKRDENRLRSIRIKNVPSALIAYQLDPANNPMPSSIQVSQMNAGKYGEQPSAKLALDNSGLLGDGSGFGNYGANASMPFANFNNPYLRTSRSVQPETRGNFQFGGGGRGGGQGGFGGGQGGFGGGQGGFGGQGGAGGGGSFDLPGDIQQIVSVDPQNVILVAGGSPEDIARLQELIDVLDQPLRQVEIESQFVELRSQDARSLGIDYSTARGNFDASTADFASDPVPGSVAVGFVRGNFSARLNALIANNRAKVITAPRVTAINNLTASLTSNEVRRLILTSTNNGLGGQTGVQQNLLNINSTTSLFVTPTINGDDTITVLMQPTVTTNDGAGALATQTSRSLQTVANVRDGDTIALGGLKAVSNGREEFKVPLLGDIPIIGGLFRSKTVTENESELIIFLKARIIRRAGDTVNVPGT